MVNPLRAFDLERYDDVQVGSIQGLRMRWPPIKQFTMQLWAFKLKWIFFVKFFNILDHFLGSIIEVGFDL